MSRRMVISRGAVEKAYARLRLRDDARRLRGRVVYVALTVRDCEGEEFHGVFPTPESARAMFEKKEDRTLRWVWDPKSRRWGVTLRGGADTFEVRKERVQ